MKRGSSGLSLLVGIDKEVSCTSHDVVNAVRHIFQEKRVGHAGTLDPLASGVLPLMVGPATRLTPYLTGQNKVYVARIVFGSATTTDDAEGETLHTGTVPLEVLSPSFMEEYVSHLKGEHTQLPPVYSAIKINGKKSYVEARRGNIIDLKPRTIQIYDARLWGYGEDEAPYWDVEFTVSKGTYIRSLARDIGKDLGCFAHLGALRRIRSGGIDIKDCVSLEALRDEATHAALDPVKALNYRFMFLTDRQYDHVSHGGALDVTGAEVFRYDKKATLQTCSCTSNIRESCAPFEAGEIVQLIAHNKLCALYAFDAQTEKLKPECVFQTGIMREALPYL